METSLERAEHEHDTRLFSFMWTPLSPMGFFRLGIGHFSFLRASVIIINQLTSCYHSKVAYFTHFHHFYCILRNLEQFLMFAFVQF